MQRITIPKHIFEDMFSYCREGYPNEACGILAGRGRGVPALPDAKCRKFASELPDGFKRTIRGHEGAPR